LTAGSLVRIVPGQVTVTGLVDIIHDEVIYSVFEQDLNIPSNTEAQAKSA